MANFVTENRIKIYQKMNCLNRKKIAFILLTFMLCAPFAHAQKELKFIEKPVSSGKRTIDKRNITAVIVHSTYNSDGGEKYDIDLIIKQFSRYRVSSHYVIGRDGVIYRLVKEKDVAFHAGKSQLPNGQTGLNSRSIGIELMTSKEEAPTEQQIKSLTILVNDIKKRYKIEYILRHSDIAPNRKTDPWNMDWDGFLQGIK
jgi:N-acetyl-anhydromuramyl-L-alanine amidase AmpD